MHIEKRQHVRFSVPDNMFAALRKESEKIGKVYDISKKGFAFSYLIRSINAGLDRDYAEVDIFLSGNRLHIRNVPCKIIYDIQELTFIKNNSIMMRRCGLSFGELMKSQLELLELFLKNYSADPLSSTLLIRRVE